MKIIGLLLMDFLKSKFFKGMCITISVMVLLWALLVPCAYVLVEIYPNIPIVNIIFEDTIKLGDMSYPELFVQSYSSPLDILLAVVFSFFLVTVVFIPLILLAFGIIIIIIFLLGLIVMFIQWLINMPYTFRQIKRYFKELKLRAKGENSDRN